ncbi:putative polysaccharide biosynthesis protein [Pseudalkalibacillus salsuginis]|uniref:putative polysaccharide biosynthesis protein n=1 Tax=Pseudalkalibacillus salsuginis TaxID=2910972 RepID=UPI001F39AF14|nr:polysaccharide biosynthesis protein [Pseudalkalibacillus salsuginis]MCF6411916.1 polysaccharide biosynthesis protein [Pseudalkalibacillus salsuginis]
MNHIDVQKTFWKGTLVISGAALFVKVLSAFYRIPYQNIAGDLGLYVFQQVYPFYAIAFALSMYGFPLMLSKMVSEGENNQLKNTLTTILIGLSSFFILVFFLLHRFSPMIAEAMNDPLLVQPLQMASYSFLFVPFLSVARGYFQGKENMGPTAISQIAEQFVRVAAILILTVWLVSAGADQYLVGTAAVFGGLTGSLMSVIVLILFLRKQRVRLEAPGRLPLRITMKMMGSLLKGGIAICITAVMLALFQLIDALQVVPGLQAGGMEVLDAKVNKGIFDRGQPLLQLGTVIATAMALPLIPFIAKSKRDEDHERIHTFTGLSLKFSFIIGGAAAVGLAVIIVPTNLFLYEDGNGSAALGILGAAILFGSLAITSSAILQGLGKIGYPVLFILSAMVLKAVLNIFLLPMFGISGAAVTTVISTAFVAFCNLIVVHRMTNVFHVQRFYSGKVLLSLILMAISTFLWKELWFFFQPEGSRVAAGFAAVSSSLLGALVYMVSLVYLNVWKYEEIIMLPKGKHLVKWLYKERSNENG